MEMVLDHYLAVLYAAESMGGTLRRLEKSLERLSRASTMGLREKRIYRFSSFSFDSVSFLIQAQNSAADTWLAGRVLSPKFSFALTVLENMTELAFVKTAASRPEKGGIATYQSMAQVLNILADRSELERI